MCRNLVSIVVTMTMVSVFDMMYIHTIQCSELVYMQLHLLQQICRPARQILIPIVCATTRLVIKQPLYNSLELG